MSSVPRSTVVGVFNTRLQANQAVADLKDAGFTESEIGVLVPHHEGPNPAVEKPDKTHAAEGAAAGVLTGLGLGALAGWGVITGVIPVIGPAIAAGTMGIVLSNAAAGAGVAGLVGALAGAGIPEDEAKYYHDELKSGRTLVAVRSTTRPADAEAILKRSGGFDTTNRPTASLSL
jgi:hypothetical protein